jgi:hypothetical protein
MAFKSEISREILRPKSGLRMTGHEHVFAIHRYRFHQTKQLIKICFDSPSSRQSPIQMRVSTIYKNMLPGDVPRLTR